MSDEHEVRVAAAFVDCSGNHFRLLPEEITDPRKIDMFRCPRCLGVVFDPDGHIVQPKMDDDKLTDVGLFGIHVCRECKAHYVFTGGRIYEISKIINLAVIREGDQREGK